MSNLILMRHGQSIWNLQNRFTGGIDVPLTRKGILQAKKAGQELKKIGVHIDIVYSSKLSRSIETAKAAIKKFNSSKMSIRVLSGNSVPIGVYPPRSYPSNLETKIHVSTGSNLCVSFNIISENII